MKFKFAPILGAFLFVTFSISNSYSLEVNAAGKGKCKASCPDGSSCEADFVGSLDCGCSNGGNGPAYCSGQDPKKQKDPLTSLFYFFNDDKCPEDTSSETK